MKKSIIYSLFLCLLIINSANAQVGKLLNNVKKSVTKELLGTPEKNNTTPKVRPEPPCACDPADLVMEMGKYQIDYTELNISVQDDGSILVRDNATGNYFVTKSGVTDGPYKEGDPKSAPFSVDSKKEVEIKEKDLPLIYKDYISKSGDKYLISFNGKNYGPFAVITRFTVSKTKDKFAAIVTENVAFTTDQGKKMEDAMKNTKSDEERMQLAMKASQQMQQNISNGGPQSLSPKFISNITGATADPMTSMSGQFYNNIKYGDIVIGTYGKIIDMQGNTLVNYSNADCDPASMFVSSDKRYACYKYGTLKLSDGKTLTELFNPHLIKEDGKIFLAYMYFSPGKNAIMQCKIPF